VRGAGPSVRARLLTGLVLLTTVFLLVMGAVSTIVLGRLEHEQFNEELVLTARSSVVAITNAPDGYNAAVVSDINGQVRLLTGASPEGAELHRYLNSLVSGNGSWYTYLRSLEGQVAGVRVAGGPALRVTAYHLDVGTHSESIDVVGAPGHYMVVVAAPTSGASTHVRELIAAEVVTGVALLMLVLIGGRWMIGRGLAPMEKMASTADMITSRGDLAARMPDPGDNAEAGRLAAAINKMLAQIQQSFAARLRSEQKVRQFAADASHELRTPLTTIRGYAELYRAGALGPDDLPNAMRRIEQESQRMSSLVAELLELARLDRDSSLDLTDTDLAEVVRDAVADARAVEPDRTVDLRAPSHLVVQVDEPRLRQVLANLISNVRSHTPPGTPATVRLTRAFDGALLEVTDDGPGMEPADAARAFDRFHRGTAQNGPDGSGVGRSVGSGLGLSIVEAIATAHGGHARLLSTAGAGTTVQVWIPVSHSHPERAVESALGEAELLEEFACRLPLTSPSATCRTVAFMPRLLMPCAPWPARPEPKLESARPALLSQRSSRRSAGRAGRSLEEPAPPLS
jgi:two-component system OmpR family sensor kinase